MIKLPESIPLSPAAQRFVRGIKTQSESRVESLIAEINSDSGRRDCLIRHHAYQARSWIELMQIRQQPYIDAQNDPENARAMGIAILKGVPFQPENLDRRLDVEAHGYGVSVYERLATSMDAYNGPGADEMRLKFADHIERWTGLVDRAKDSKGGKWNRNAQIVANQIIIAELPQICVEINQLIDLLVQDS